MTAEMSLIDAPLVPDPDAAEELAVDTPETIADQHIAGCRFLLSLRAVEAIGVAEGGAVQLTCVFHPAFEVRFSWARVVLRLTSPEGACFADVAPVEVREDELVSFAVDRGRKLSLSYAGAEAGAEHAVRKEYTVYHCKLRGSGSGTSLARWDFAENPHRRDGLGGQHVLGLTLPITGRVEGVVAVTARVVRPGLAGRMDAIRDLIFRQEPQGRFYPITLDIPKSAPPPVDCFFFRIE